MDAQQLKVYNVRAKCRRRRSMLTGTQDSFLKQVIPGIRDHLMLENVFTSLITLTLKVKNGFP